MFVLVLFRILILASLLLLIFTLIQYLRNPQRRLQIAKNTDSFFFMDDRDNSKKNFQITYKGALFEGEKYLGTTEDAFEVVNISITISNPMELSGMNREDLYFLEKEILIRYPFAKIEWKHPINQLFQ
ncbi:sigma-w pathway protein ysdB [Virgibacillus sp. 179-BFC.A HS]|uniref:Sigma-w pathway protein ysdB n=1 Tax=Tigheibacillus jepli TaxID=3035914 RepID=A0ABU5CHT3_9BACI|nr:sigma-w pathway protein ysdB [Virgibacillus sp. 179-BFC.A HS]MDY0405374.1 sigma-w pathway protein ysdB [Virgibacillus sp. 179-BFC.A HS]